MAKKLSKNEIEKRLLKHNIIILSEYKNIKTKISCKCFCGKKFDVTPVNILRSKTPCCGCKKDRSGIRNLVGNRYNKLVVIKFYRYKYINKGKTRERIWKCLCDCGNICYFSTGYLKHYSNYISCGCVKYHRGTKTNSKLWKGVGDISGSFWGHVKKNSKKRGISFDLSIEEAWGLFLKQKKKCSLSGIRLTFGSKCNCNKNEISASLDRIDSNLGYNINNIHWIHKTINSMKHDLKYNKFLYYCYLISHPIKKIRIDDYYIVKKHGNNWQGYKNINKSYWSRTLRNAKKRNIKLDISIKDIWNLLLDQNGKCALTGLNIDFNYHCGTASIDRIDSNGSYSLNNIHLIHKDINRKLKKAMSIKSLYQWCDIICKNNNCPIYDLSMEMV